MTKKRECTHCNGTGRIRDKIYPYTEIPCKRCFGTGDEPQPRDDRYEVDREVRKTWPEKFKPLRKEIRKIIDEQWKWSLNGPMPIPSIKQVSSDNPHGSNWQIKETDKGDYRETVGQNHYTHFIVFKSDEGYEADYVYNETLDKWELGAN